LSLRARALAAYASREVERICLELQDEHDQCVSYLLWALWAEERQGAVDAALAMRAAALARTFEIGVLKPLRTARRTLKAEIDGVLDPEREAARERVKADELAGEELLLRSLEAMTPTTIATRDQGGALEAASAAWAPPPPPARLAALASAFSRTRFSATRPANMAISEDPPLANDEAIHARIAELRLAHQDLDDAVNALSAKTVPDQLQIARLKKQKLALRDQITRLEDRLTPDIIA
jgi:uncharacterized protein (TIGR02444 family)